MWTGLPDDHDPETVEVRDGLVVRRFPMPLPATRVAAVSHAATTGWRTMRGLRRAVDTFRPDVLHVQCFGPNGAYATALARLCRVPLVITPAGRDADGRRRHLRHVPGSAGLAAGRHPHGGRRHRLLGVHPRRRRLPLRARPGPGLGDLQRRVARTADRAMRPGPSCRHPLDDVPYVLALGRVVDKKGFDLLLAGYAAMDPTRRTADLVIGGTGSALERLEAQAEESGIADRVHFVGRLSREQVAAAMAGARVFVMPSRLEPFGIVVLEGWRAGTAVVATNRGGPPEFVHDGEDGLLVDPFDTAAVADRPRSGPVRRRPPPRHRRGRSGAGSSRSAGPGSPRSTGPSIDPWATTAPSGWRRDRDGHLAGGPGPGVGRRGRRIGAPLRRPLSDPGVHAP